MEGIGTLIARAREAAGMTQAEVAAARHVSRGAQSQIELASARPGWDTIDAFAKAIDAVVTIQFDLATGAVVSGHCAGTHRPTLLDDLDRDAADARAKAIAAGWRISGDRQVHREPTGHGEFATVDKVVTIINPGWAERNALAVLMSAAVATSIDPSESSLFNSHMTESLDVIEELGDRELVDVTTMSQLALDALLDATRNAAWMAKDYVTTPVWNLQPLPVRNLDAYLAGGAPGADEVMALVNRVSRNANWRLAILRQAGYLYGEPSDFAHLPHVVVED